MSARAAARLDWMGFAPVYEYANGKSDWFAAGLERAGEYAAVPRIGDFAEAAVTCGPEEDIGGVRERLRAAGRSTCVVVNSDGVVLGVIRDHALSAAGAGDSAATVMHPGPKTYRADYLLEDPLEYMQSTHLGDTIVTSPDGKLVGVSPLEPVRRCVEQMRRLLATGRDGRASAG